MINVLIADDNVEHTKQLITAVSAASEKVNVYQISTDGQETLNLLNTDNNIDLVILDLKMPKYSGIEILNLLSSSKKEKYYNSVIAISGDSDMLLQIRTNPMIYAYIQKPICISEIVNILNKLAISRESFCLADLKQKINYELQYLGYELSYKGTQYLSDTIYLFMTTQENDNYLCNLEKEIYPILSKKYHKSIANIKWNITNATSLMYCQCEISRLKEYFQFFTDVKPKTKNIIYTIIDKIQYS